MQTYPTKEVQIDTIKLPPVTTTGQEKEHYEKIVADLAESIKQQGLLHQPIIREDGQIVAGGKRIRAVKLAFPEAKSIVCRIVPNGLKEIDYRTISLHENLKRHNLAWQEQILSEKELHDLRQSQYGKSKIGRTGGGWGLADTAKELDMAVGTLSEDYRMAEAILQDPSLRAIKDKETARRVILTSLKRQSQEIGAGIHFNEVEKNQVYCGDSSEVLKTFPNGIFDAVITDPPWLEFRDETLIKDEFTDHVFRETFRVTKGNGFLLMFVGTQDWIYYNTSLQKVGYEVQKYPLIWAKPGVLTYGTKSWQTNRDYELILLAVKGSPALTANMISSILTYPPIPPAKLTHPNEKPLELIERILEICTYENSLILDPFAGSGVVGDACAKNGRPYILIERNEEFFYKIKKRLGKV